jgi:hypothetical protein
MNFMRIFGTMADLFTKRPIQVDDVGRINVSSPHKVIRVTKALAAAGNYSAEDVLSESASVGTAWKFRNALDPYKDKGVIVKAIALCSTTGLVPRLRVYLFSATPTSMLNDNEGNTTLITADLPNYLGWIDFPGLTDLGGYSETIATPNTSGNLPFSFVLAGKPKDLYGLVVTRDAETNEAAGMTLTIELEIEQY